MFLLSGATSPKRLNAYLAITPGGLTKTIQRLEQQRLVKREPDSDDGRGTLISITKKGERVAARVFEDDVEDLGGLRRCPQTPSPCDAYPRRRPPGRSRWATSTSRS